jgi:ATP-dependent helicase HrpA
VSLRLFRSQEAARRASLGGCRRLVSLTLQKDLAWLHKDMRALSKFAPMTAGWLTAEELAETAFENLRAHLLPAEAFPTLTEAAFKAALEQARGLLPGLSVQMTDRLGVIFKLRQDVCLRCKVSTPAPLAAKPRVISDFRQLGAVVAPAPVTNRWMTELNQLLPANFLEIVTYAKLPQLPRYLKALLIRMERAALNPVKDQERERQLAPFTAELHKIISRPPASPEGLKALNEYRWMVEEFKVSLFAQELGTAFSISAQKLNEQLKRIA